MPEQTRKFNPRPSYANVHKLEHKGHLGFKNGRYITTHIVNMLDDNNCYKFKDGKWYVRDLNVEPRKTKNGVRFVKDEGKWISLEDHNKRYYPKIRNPAVL